MATYLVRLAIGSLPHGTIRTIAELFGDFVPVHDRAAGNGVGGDVL